MGQWYVRECKEAIWDNGKSGGVKRPYGTMVSQALNLRL